MCRSTLCPRRQLVELTLSMNSVLSQKERLPDIRERTSDTTLEVRNLQEEAVPQTTALSSASPDPTPEKAFPLERVKGRRIFIGDEPSFGTSSSTDSEADPFLISYSRRRACTGCPEGDAAHRQRESASNAGKRTTLSCLLKLLNQHAELSHRLHRQLTSCC